MGVFLGFDDKKHSYMIMDIEINKMHFTNFVYFVEEEPSKYKYETNNYKDPYFSFMKDINRKNRNTEGQEEENIKTNENNVQNNNIHENIQNNNNNIHENTIYEENNLNRENNLNERNILNEENTLNEEYRNA